MDKTTQLEIVEEVRGLLPDIEDAVKAGDELMIGQYARQLQFAAAGLAPRQYGE
jgi:hypothetical protein